MDDNTRAYIKNGGGRVGPPTAAYPMETVESAERLPAKLSEALSVGRGLAVLQAPASAGLTWSASIAMGARVIELDVGREMMSEGSQRAMSEVDHALKRAKSQGMGVALLGADGLPRDVFCAVVVLAREAAEQGVSIIISGHDDLSEAMSQPVAQARLIGPAVVSGYSPIVAQFRDGSFRGAMDRERLASAEAGTLETAPSLGEMARKLALRRESERQCSPPAPAAKSAA